MSRTKTQPPRRETLITYHAGCLDGVAAAWLAARGATRRGETCSFLPYDHARQAQSVQSLRRAFRPGLEILSVDHALPRDVMAELARTPGLRGLRVRDHHQSSAENLLGFPQDGRVDIRINPARPSATGMLWDEVEPGRAKPAFVDLMDRMDGSGLRLAGRPDFSAAAYVDSVVPLNDVERAIPVLESLARMSFNEMASQGCYLHDHQSRASRTLVQQGEMKDLNGIPAWVVPVDVRRCGRAVSRTLLTGAQERGASLAAAWTTGKTGWVVVSLRSNGDPNCATLAGEIQQRIKGASGGGHADAAGISLPSKETLDALLTGVEGLKPALSHVRR